MEIRRRYSLADEDGNKGKLSEDLKGQCHGFLFSAAELWQIKNRRVQKGCLENRTESIFLKNL